MQIDLQSLHRGRLFPGLLAAALWAGWAYAAEPAASDAQRDQVAQAIAASMKAHEVPGVSIAVVNDYQIDWAAGYGVLKAGEARPVTPTTLFQAASISKPVAALAAPAHRRAGPTLARRRRQPAPHVVACSR